MTGKSRLNARGNMRAETVLINESTKEALELVSRMAIHPLCTVIPVKTSIYFVEI
jgi:hypothetical protein